MASTADGDSIAHLIAAEQDSLHVLHWRTPTSIFIGISPLKFAKKSIQSAAVRAFNPAEHRWQIETVRVGKATGIVLRGGRSYGWASQSVVPEDRAGDYMCNLGSPRTLPGAIAKLQRAVLACTDTCASFDTKHKSQLLRLNSLSRPTRAIARLIRSVLRAGVTRFRFVVRLYGGACTRTVATFGDVARHLKIDTVPEMWGDGRTRISSATRDLLVGFETRPDGTISYVRISRADVPSEHSST